MGERYEAAKKAREIRNIHFLNIALAAVGRGKGDLETACDMAEQAVADALRKAAAPPPDTGRDTVTPRDTGGGER